MYKLGLFIVQEWLLDRVRTCQLNGHSRSLNFSAIIIVTIIMMVVMIMIVAPCCPLSLFGFYETLL